MRCLLLNECLCLCRLHQLQNLFGYVHLDEKKYSQIMYDRVIKHVPHMVGL